LKSESECSGMLRASSVGRGYPSAHAKNTGTTRLEFIEFELK